MFKLKQCVALVFLLAVGMPAPTNAQSQTEEPSHRLNVTFGVLEGDRRQLAVAAQWVPFRPVWRPTVSVEAVTLHSTMGWRVAAGAQRRVWGTGRGVGVLLSSDLGVDVPAGVSISAGVELAFGAGSWTRWGIELQRRLRYRTTGDIEHVTGVFLRYTLWPGI